jgi:hypothetical protein
MYVYTIWLKVSRHPSVVVNWSPDVTMTAFTSIKGSRKLCCSLLSSTCKMARSGELSDFIHGLVIGCHISKKSVRDIATILKLLKSTDGDVIMTWKHESTTTTKPRLGRLRLITDRDQWALKKMVRKSHQSETITHEFHSVVNCPASTMTVHQELRGIGFHGWVAAHKPNTLPVNTKCLLNWCKERCHWTVDNWKRVIWGDESHYTIWQSNGMVCVWQCLENNTCQHV